jgi:cytochrome c
VRRAAACAILVAGGLGFAPAAGLAQAGPESAPAPDGAALFRQQCATCHTLSASDPPRQGPTLAGVYGRKPGSVPGFHYSPGYAKADFVWDDTHLNAYLTNPQAVIPGSIMPYRQAKAPVRQAIIAFLKEQH